MIGVLLTKKLSVINEKVTVKSSFWSIKHPRLTCCSCSVLDGKQRSSVIKTGIKYRQKPEYNFVQTTHIISGNLGRDGKADFYSFDDYDTENEIFTTLSHVLFTEKSRILLL